MKKGRHRRYEEARNLKRGPDLDIEGLFADLEGEPAVVAAAVDDSPRDDQDSERGDEVDDYSDDATDDVER